MAGTLAKRDLHPNGLLNPNQLRNVKSGLAKGYFVIARSSRVVAIALRFQFSQNQSFGWDVEEYRVRKELQTGKLSSTV